MSEEVLSIKINHTKPLELKLFTASILCIESQYKSYLSKNKINDEQYNLCITEVKQGSIIINFIKKKGLELVENYAIAHFIEKYLKPKIENIVEQKIEKETGYTLKEIKEVLSIVSVLSDDYKSTMDIDVHIGNKKITNYSFTGIEANAIASECMRLMKEYPSEQEIRKNVVLHWKQAGEKTKSLSIDKGIIEEVDPKRLVRIICDEDLKSVMVSENEKNPFGMFYIVDAEVKTISGKPIAYIIKHIHSKGILDNK